MSGFPLTVPKPQFFDANGNPLVNGTLEVFQAGTSTPEPLYTGSDLATPAGTSFALNGRGEAASPLFGDYNKGYKFVLKDALGATVYSFDDYRRRSGIYFDITAAEIAAGVTPTDYGYAPGDVRRYGTNTVPGTTDMAAAIQNALDANGFVALEKGKIHQVSTAVLMDDSEIIIGYGRDTVIRGNLATGVIKARNGVSSRSYYLGGRDFTVDNTSRATSGGIGLDMSGVAMGKWFNVGITNVETGVKQLGAGAVGCFYNEYHACDISGVVTGYDNGTLANENKVFGGRVNDCVTGTIDDDNSCNSYFGLAIEAFTSAGHSSSPTAAALLTRYIGSRLENLPTSGTGILIGATAQDTFIEAPYFTGLTTDINDAGSRTTVLMPRGTTQKYLQFNGGTAIAKYLKVAVVRDVASLGAATARQEGPFTVTGCAVGDTVTCTLPAAWPNNIIAGVPIVSATDTVYVPMYNPSGGAVDPSSGTFIFSVLKH